MSVAWTVENDLKLFMALLKAWEGPIPHIKIAKELMDMGVGELTQQAVRRHIEKLKGDIAAGKGYAAGMNANDSMDDLSGSTKKRTAARTSTPKMPKTPTMVSATTTPGNTEKRKRVLEDIGFHVNDGSPVGGSGQHRTTKVMRHLSPMPSMETEIEHPSAMSYDQEIVSHAATTYGQEIGSREAISSSSSSSSDMHVGGETREQYPENEGLSLTEGNFSILDQDDEGHFADLEDFYDMDSYYVPD